MQPTFRQSIQRSGASPLKTLAVATAMGIAASGPMLAQQADIGQETLLPGQEGAQMQPGMAGEEPFAERRTPPAPVSVPAPIAATEPAVTPATAVRTAETDDFATGTVPEPAMGPVAEGPEMREQRVEAIEGLNRPSEENPYAAVGIRFGSFILKPTLETGLTATSNADSSTNGSAATLSETTLRLNAASDWSQHRASIDAFGTYRKTLSGQEVEHFAGGVDAELELDIGHDYRAKGTFTYLAAPESAASPVVISDAVEEPLRQTVGGTLGLEKHAGKARFGITGGISHDSYGDADLEDGSTLSQKDRDATLYTLAIRAGYEVSPALTPFVEAEIGRNLYTQRVDSAGFERSGDQYALRAGLAFDRGEKFSGEIAAGWMRETFDDARLGPLSAPSIEANFLWSPVRGTNVRLDGSTIFEGTTTPGESGSVLYSADLSVERLMRANLTAQAALGAGYRDYSNSGGYDVIFDAEASLTWWLNRYTGIVGRVRHETVSSNLPDRDSETNSVFVGLKLQR